MKELSELYKETLNKIRIDKIAYTGIPINIDIVNYTLNDFLKDKSDSK